MSAGRCRVPALPRPVVGVSPAAGDKPQPYIRTAALPPAAGDQRRPYIRSAALPPAAGMGAGGTGGGVAAGGTSGRWSLCGRTVQLLHVAE